MAKVGIGFYLSLLVLFVFLWFAIRAIASGFEMEPTLVAAGLLGLLGAIGNGMADAETRKDISDIANSVRKRKE